MPRYTYTGPQEYSFPHQRALEGAAGTLVLTPGESYDFGLDATGQDARPIGPAWWWDPQPPPEEIPDAEAETPVANGDAAPHGDTYGDTYGGNPAGAGG